MIFIKKVLILFGSNSFEHNISCKSVNFILDNIDKKLFNYVLVGIDFKSNWYEIKENAYIDDNWLNLKLEKINNIIEFLKNFDIVFPIIHGNTGEDGKIQSMLELFNIKYVGCNSYSNIICYDKLLTKLILEKYNIPQVPYNDLNNFPVIIKPTKCGSSLGIKIANNKKELNECIKFALKYDNNYIVEKYIENKRELECSILEKNNKLIISDIGEIINNGCYSYEKKYEKNTKTKISDIDKNIKKDIQKYSKKIFKILNCKDLSRIDFIYDIDNKKLYFNEINTMPGLTNISMYPILIKNSGINYKKMLTILLNN